MEAVSNRAGIKAKSEIQQASKEVQDLQDRIEDAFESGDIERAQELSDQLDDPIDRVQEARKVRLFSGIVGGG